MVRCGYDLKNSNLTTRLFCHPWYLEYHLWIDSVCKSPFNQDSWREVTPASLFWPPWCYWKPLTAFSQALLVLSLACAAVVAPLQNIEKYRKIHNVFVSILEGVFSRTDFSISNSPLLVFWLDRCSPSAADQDEEDKKGKQRIQASGCGCTWGRFSQTFLIGLSCFFHISREVGWLQIFSFVFGNFDVNKRHS